MALIYLNTGLKYRPYGLIKPNIQAYGLTAFKLIYRPN